MVGQVERPPHPPTPPAAQLEKSTETTNSDPQAHRAWVRFVGESDLGIHHLSFLIRTNCRSKVTFCDRHHMTNGRFRKRSKMLAEVSPSPKDYPRQFGRDLFPENQLGHAQD